MKKFFLSFLFLVLIPRASAESTDNQQTLLMPTLGEQPPVEIHGFLSQGFLQSTGNNALPTSKDGTTDFSDAGITINKMLANNLRAGFQLFARDFGRTGNFNAKFDWFLLDYHWRDWLGVRAGRVKIPYGLYNETNDIDSTRNTIFLPNSLYPNDQRDYLLAQNGVDLYGFVDLPYAGALDYRLYRGTLNVPAGSTVGLPYQIATSDVPFVQGGRLIWETPLKGLRVGGTYQNLAYKSDIWIPSISKTVSTELKVSMGVGSLEYTTRWFQFATEYARWWGEFDSSLPTVLVPVRVTHERYYGMVSVNATEWLHPGVYYAATYPNSEKRSKPSEFSRETAVFCRVDLTTNWTGKVEWHYMDGTAGLDPGINDGLQPNQMAGYWQMFMAKTTVYF